VSIKYEKYELKDIISLIREHNILLPNFQRDYVWKPAQQERLSISCLLGLPIGGLLMLKGQSSDFSHRDIAGLSSMSSKVGEKEVNFLLDGQQRITTLKFIFDDPFFHPEKNWDDVCREIPKSLKVKYFIDVSAHESSSDPFGFNGLKVTSIDSLEPTDLENRIKVAKVNISGGTVKQFHHPKKFIELENVAKREGKKSPSHTAALELVRHFSEKKQIPLFTVFWDKKYSRYPYALHEKVIEKIAKNRAEELKADFSGSTEQEIFEFFDNIHTGLSEEIIDADTGEPDVDKGWSELASRWARNVVSVFDSVRSMEMPSTDLPQKEISRAASIFEELNNSGTKLRVFDLLVARAARDKFLGKRTLSDFIIDKVKAENDISNLRVGITNWKATELGVLDGKILDNQFQDVYLNLLSLISNAKDEKLMAGDVKFIKKDAILSIPPEKITRNTARTILGISRALAFIQSKCGISKLAELPYLLMILPIAYCFEEDKLWNCQISREKLEFWYWDSLFSGRYRERQNERCVQDVERITNWLKVNISPYEASYIPNLLDDSKYNDIDTLLMKAPENLPNENVAKSIRQFVLTNKPRDFDDDAKQLIVRDVSLGRLTLQKHHIIPLGSATTIKQSSNEIRQKKEHILNSPLNFSMISDSANNSIGALPISSYMAKLPSWSATSHYISSNVTKNGAESENEYYERLLRDRYSKIKDAITNRLNELSSDIFNQEGSSVK